MLPYSLRIVSTYAASYSFFCMRILYFVIIFHTPAEFVVLEATTFQPVIVFVFWLYLRFIQNFRLRAIPVLNIKLHNVRISQSSQHTRLPYKAVHQLRINWRPRGRCDLNWINYEHGELTNCCRKCKRVKKNYEIMGYFHRYSVEAAPYLDTEFNKPGDATAARLNRETRIYETQ